MVDEHPAAVRARRGGGSRGHRGLNGHVRHRQPRTLAEAEDVDPPVRALAIDHGWIRDGVEVPGRVIPPKNCDRLAEHADDVLVTSGGIWHLIGSTCYEDGVVRAGLVHRVVDIATR